MADHDFLRMRPTDVADASAQLDALASRVEELMKAEDPNLTVQAGARDEVSQRVALTLNGVHETFGKSAVQGATEMRETAATLRSQVDDVTSLDDGFTV